jgi:hypothetical protein
MALENHTDSFLLAWLCATLSTAACHQVMTRYMQFVHVRGILIDAALHLLLWDDSSLMDCGRLLQTLNKIA